MGHRLDSTETGKELMSAQSVRGNGVKITRIETIPFALLYKKPMRSTAESEPFAQQLSVPPR